MRTQVAFTTLLVVAITNLASGAPRAFEKTVAPFDPSPYILPTNVPKTWVQKVPMPDGSFVDVGSGTYSHRFYQWVYPWFTPWVSTRQGLDREATDFQEFINDRGATLQKRVAATSSDKLQNLNSDMTGQIKTELNLYENARDDERKAGQEIRGASELIKAALKDVEHNEDLIKAQEAADQKAALAAKSADLKAEVAASKQVQEIFSKAVGVGVDLVAIVADPAGSAMKAFNMVGGAIIGAAIDEHETELMVLDLQMKALDETIAKHKNDAQTAALEKAQHQLNAAGIQMVVKMLDEQKYIRIQGQALEDLADLEKGAKNKHNPNATDVFYDLRLNHHEFMLAAMDLRNRLTRYQIVVDRGPGRHAVTTTPFLTKSIDEVSRYSKPDEGWLGMARVSRDYMQKYGDWYTKEHAYLALQEKALNDRVEVLPIDAAVQQLKAKF